MKVAFGWKAHSGWAVLVVLGTTRDDLQIIDRRRVELVEKDDLHWAKQPYHAAEGLSQSDARKTVQRGIKAASGIALREMRTAVKRAEQGGHKVVGCALLVGDPMPDWSVDEILAVHFRMHKAEGVLFRDVLRQAASQCGLKLVEIPEKFLLENAENALDTPASTLLKRSAMLGKSVGPPWTKDHKDAALAAMIALQGR